MKRAWSGLLALVILFSTFPLNSAAEQPTFDSIELQPVTPEERLALEQASYEESTALSEEAELAIHSEKIKAYEEAAAAQKIEKERMASAKSAELGPNPFDFKVESVDGDYARVSFVSVADAEIVLGIPDSKEALPYEFSSGETVELELATQYFYTIKYTDNKNIVSYQGVLKVLFDIDEVPYIEYENKAVNTSGLQYEAAVKQHGLSDNAIADIPLESEQLVDVEGDTDSAELNEAEVQVRGDATATRGILLPVASEFADKGAFAIAAAGTIYEKSTTNETYSNAQQIYDDYDVYGKINPSGDVDWYYVTFPSAGTANFWLGVNYQGLTQDYELAVYSSNGTTLLARSINGGSSDELISDLSIAANTRYYIKVYGFGSAYNSSTYYKLRTKQTSGAGTDDHSNQMGSSATLLTVDGPAIQGNIDYAGDIDVFRFTLNQSTRVNLFSTGVTNSLVDMYGSLYKQNGTNSFTFIVSDDQSGGNNQFLIDRTLEAGTYYLQAKHYNPAVLNLRYKVQAQTYGDDHGDTSSNATTLTLGTWKNGVIDYATDADYFKFTVSQAGIYKVRVQGIKGPGMSYPTEMRGWLYNSALTELAYSGTIVAGGEVQCRISLNLGTGTYYIKVRACYDHVYPDAIGPYKVIALKDDHVDAQGSTATALPLGSSVAGKIDLPEEVDYFKLTVPTKGAYEFISLGSTNVVGTLYNSAGTSLVSDDNSGGSQQFKLDYLCEANGTYYLKVNHASSTDTGTYSVRASKLSVGIVLVHGFASAMMTDSTILGSDKYVWDPTIIPFNQMSTRLARLEVYPNGNPRYGTVSFVENATVADGMESLRSRLTLEFPYCSVVQFSYDWRRDNSYTAEKLRTFINNNGFDQVYLVAHSMGGLISSKYMLDTTNNNKIKRLITIGTPFRGAPGSLHAFETGDKGSIFTDAFTHITVDEGLLKSLYGNFPALYQLLPNNRHAPYIKINGSLKPITAAQAFLETRPFTQAGTEPSGQPIIKQMLGDAYGFHASLLVNSVHIADSSGKSYYIAGTTWATINEIVYTGSPLSESYLKVGDGDGTVLINSANNGSNNYYQSHAPHSGMLGDHSVLNRVVLVIRNAAIGQNTAYGTSAPAPISARHWLEDSNNQLIHLVTQGIDELRITDANGLNYNEADGKIVVENRNGIQEEVGMVWTLNRENNRKQYVLPRATYEVEILNYMDTETEQSVLIQYTDMGYYDVFERVAGLQQHGVKFINLSADGSTSFKDSSKDLVVPEKTSEDLDVHNFDDIVSLLSPEVYSMMSGNDESLICILANNVEDISFSRNAGKTKSKVVSYSPNTNINEVPDVLEIQTRKQGKLYVLVDDNYTLSIANSNEDASLVVQHIKEGNYTNQVKCDDIEIGSFSAEIRKTSSIDGIDMIQGEITRKSTIEEASHDYLSTINDLVN